MGSFDAVVVGSGPNGLAAALELAEAGLKVQVREAEHTPGGGVRSGPLMEEGFIHDWCSAIHPMAQMSPVFQAFGLERFGLEWVTPTAPAAHSFADGRAVLQRRTVEQTASGLGPDGDAYRRLYTSLSADLNQLIPDLLAPFSPFPRHPFKMLGFAAKALRSAKGLAGSSFKTEEARALFAGIAAHSVVPLDRLMTAAAGIMLGAAGHTSGWPFPKGGSQSLTTALISALEERGGELLCAAPVNRLEELDTAGPVLFDTSPAEMLRIVGEGLPPRYHRAVRRFRYGPGSFKVDYSLDGPIPWRNQECAQSATVHVGDSFEAVAEAEAAPWRGDIPERPFLLVTQPSLFDPSRAPPGKHTAWAYFHVPHGCTEDLTQLMEDTLERHAPGFRQVVRGRHVTTAAGQAEKNRNLIGGDLGGGAMTLGQLFTRPVVRWDPYSTPNSRVFICSASTPPGGGVHGMCGYHAARSVLRRLWWR